MGKNGTAKRSRKRPAARAVQVAAATNGGSGNGWTHSWAPYFEALGSSKDRTPIPYGLGLWGQLATMSWGRIQLCGIARWLFDNVPLVAYALDLAANYTVPVKAQATLADTALGDTFEAYFADWAERADFTG